MSIDNILNALDGVKSRGQGRYMALCPVHSEKHGSLAITDKEDGVTVLHCFGCGASGLDVLAALGLEPSELFPPKLDPHKRTRTPFPAQDVLHALYHESTIIALAASDIINKKQISHIDLPRIILAHKRITAAVEYAKN